MSPHTPSASSLRGATPQRTPTRGFPGGTNRQNPVHVGLQAGCKPAPCDGRSAQVPQQQRHECPRRIPELQLLVTNDHPEVRVLGAFQRVFRDVPLLNGWRQVRITSIRYRQGAEGLQMGTILKAGPGICMKASNTQKASHPPTRETAAWGPRLQRKDDPTASGWRTVGHHPNAQPWRIHELHGRIHGTRDTLYPLS